MSPFGVGTGLGGSWLEGDTARLEAVGSGTLFLHVLRKATEGARSALNRDPKHHSVRLAATRRQASQRFVWAQLPVRGEQAPRRVDVNRAE